MEQKSIMDRIHENIDPTSVSNAIYEMMVDWNGMIIRLNNDLTTHRARTKDKVRHLEAILSRFFNVDPIEMRSILEQHFGIKRAGR